jgi:hypothetical protein
MQEYREVTPDLRVAGVEHLLRRGADHDPVAFAYGKAEQFRRGRRRRRGSFHSRDESGPAGAGLSHSFATEERLGCRTRVWPISGTGRIIGQHGRH